MTRASQRLASSRTPLLTPPLCRAAAPTHRVWPMSSPLLDEGRFDGLCDDEAMPIRLRGESRKTAVRAAFSCHRPRKRAIQYAGTAMIESTGRGVLDAPLEAGHDIVGGGRLLPGGCNDASLSTCQAQGRHPSRRLQAEPLLQHIADDRRVRHCGTRGPFSGLCDDEGMRVICPTCQV